MFCPLKTWRKNTQSEYTRQIDHWFASNSISGYISGIETESDHLGMDITLSGRDRSKTIKYPTFRAGLSKILTSRARLEKWTE